MTTVKDLLLVFLGGGVGSVLRYLLACIVPWLIRSLGNGQPRAEAASPLFPWATFAANLLGCFLLGLFCALLLRCHWPQSARLFLVVGLCGGFTTFSTFSNETLQLLLGGHTAVAVLYVVSSLLAGGVMVWAGLRLLG